jgi:hypothetical protein
VIELGSVKIPLLANDGDDEILKKFADLVTQINNALENKSEDYDKVL